MRIGDKIKKIHSNLKKYPDLDFNATYTVEFVSASGGYISISESPNQILFASDFYLVSAENVQRRYGVITEVKEECMHEMRAYVGLYETYDYCTKCDEKRKNA